MISLFGCNKIDAIQFDLLQIKKDMQSYIGINFVSDVDHDPSVLIYDHLPEDSDLKKVTALIISNLKKNLRNQASLFHFSRLSSPDLYPFPVIDLEFQVGRCQPEISFIIPCYNNRVHLHKTISHLIEPSSSIPIEIIVVDDGSTDLDSYEFEKWLKLHIKNHVQLKYVYFPRRSLRKMGDQLFRAGIARNLGVLHSTSEILAFLDSDVVVHPQYSSEILNSVDSEKILQTRRYDLTMQDSVQPDYLKLSVEKCLHDDPYWSAFNSETTPWRHMKNHWKYTCSHSLSLLKKDFYTLGWFRPQYNFYGFEDTDLGYRAHLKNFSFELLKEPSFHLYHRPERSEYKQNANLRQLLLRKSCRRFLQYNPHPEVLDVFSFYLN